MRIKIFTEFGNKIGLGHITRMQALSDFFTEKLDQCEILKYENGIQETNWIENKSLRNELHHFDAIIIDSYLCPAEVYSEIFSQNPNTIAIDDFNRIKYPVKVLINPNIFYSSLDYFNQECSCFGGSDFIILRKSFRNKPINIEIKGKILVTLGGSDYRDLFPKLISLSNQFADVKYVIPEKNKFDSLNSKFQNLDLVNLLNEKQFYDELSKANIVISACGQTLHECSSLNKTTIGICVDIDQEPNKKFYQENNFLYSSYQWNDVDLLPNINNDCLQILKNSDNKFKPVLNIFNPQNNLENYKKIISEMI